MKDFVENTLEFRCKEIIDIYAAENQINQK